MKLYFANGTCSLAPHIVLLETGLRYETARVDIRKKLVGEANYLEINPKGYIPALQLENGNVMTECVAILQYLADQAPDRKLVPPWTESERYKAIEWLNFIATEVHKGFSPLFAPDVPPATREALVAKLQKRFATIEETLTGRDFLMGATFSIVDAYLFTVMRWAAYLKVDTSAYKNLAAYMERVGARPSVQTAIREESAG